MGAMRTIVPLVVFLLATLPLVAAPPAWVTGLGIDPAYPPATHLTGFGLASTGADEASLRREAVTMAREALASAIRTRITSAFVKETTVHDQGMTNFARAVVRTQTSLELEGLDHYAYHFDPGKRTYYCLAILERNRTARTLTSEIARQGAEVRVLYDKSRLAHDLTGLLQVSREVRRLAERRVMYRAVADADLPPSPAPTAGEVGQAIRTLLAAKKGLDGSLASAAFELGSAFPDGIRVWVARIRYADTPFSGSFATYAEQAVAGQLTAMGGLHLVDATALKDILLTRGPDVNAAEALHSQAVVHGSYFDLGGEVRLNLRATSVSGEELASASVRIPASEIAKAQLALTPSNHAAATQLLAPQVQGSELRLQLTTDRGDGGIYRKGERVHLFLKANLDCRVTIVYHQVDGSKVVIFPNRFQPDARIEKNRLYQIPPDATAFKLAVVGPFGAEVIKAHASTEPLLGEPGGSGVGTKGIAVFAGESLEAEATVVINTVDQP